MFAEPKVVTVMREYREAMAAREFALMQDMATRWVEIEHAVSGKAALLQMAMVKAAGDGKVITQQMVWREEYYKQLKGEIYDQIRSYNKNYLIPTIEKSQSDFGWFGVQAASDAIRASYTTGFGKNFKIVNREAVETMVGFLGNGAPLNSLLKNDYPEALDGLVNALINGVSLGSSPTQIAADMSDGLGMGLERALLIARTETNRTYRTAIAQEYRESNVVKGFRRLVKKDTACMGCLFLDGELFDLQSELDDHPRGKCQAVPIVIGVGSPKWEKGSDWFLNLDPEQQKERMGEELFARWKEEGFDLSSLVSKRHSDEWGDSPVFNAGSE
jgi:hypothetical protein